MITTLSRNRTRGWQAENRLDSFTDNGFQNGGLLHTACKHHGQSDFERGRESVLYLPGELEPTAWDQTWKTLQKWCVQQRQWTVLRQKPEGDAWNSGPLPHGGASPAKQPLQHVNTKGEFPSTEPWSLIIYINLHLNFNHNFTYCVNGFTTHWTPIR